MKLAATNCPREKKTPCFPVRSRAIDGNWKHTELNTYHITTKLCCFMAFKKTKFWVNTFIRRLYPNHACQHTHTHTPTIRHHPSKRPPTCTQHPSTRPPHTYTTSVDTFVHTYTTSVHTFVHTYTTSVHTYTTSVHTYTTSVHTSVHTSTHVQHHVRRPSYPPSPTLLKTIINETLRKANI